MRFYILLSLPIMRFQGTKFKLFVIEGGGGNDCKDMIQKYLQQTGNPDEESDRRALQNIGSLPWRY